MFGKFSRRQFAKLAGFSALGIAAAPADAAAQAAADRHAPASFPKDFLWGTATSAYQIEGAVNEDGRGRSIWDTFAHTPGKIEDHTTADRANDHYHRYKEDVGLIRNRWASRPTGSRSRGRGYFPKAPARPIPRASTSTTASSTNCSPTASSPTRRCITGTCRRRSRTGSAAGGPATPRKHSRDYAGYVAERISDRVKNIFTLNEAGRFLNFGYGWGIDAPGLKLPTAEVEPGAASCRAGAGLAVQAIRAHGRAGTRVGPAENIAACVPAFDTPDNVRAAEMATRELNSGLLGVMLEGKYTDGFLEYSRQGRAEIHA